jgi:hypothetical protein
MHGSLPTASFLSSAVCRDVQRVLIIFVEGAVSKPTTMTSNPQTVATTTIPRDDRVVGPEPGSPSAVLMELRWARFPVAETESARSGLPWTILHLRFFCNFLMMRYVHQNCNKQLSPPPFPLRVKSEIPERPLLRRWFLAALLLLVTSRSPERWGVARSRLWSCIAVGVRPSGFRVCLLTLLGKQL